MTHLYKKLSIAALLVAFIWAYYAHIFYALYWIGIYPVKAQIKHVSVELNGTWLPLPYEIWEWFSSNSQSSLPTRVFVKIEGLKPRTYGAMGVSLIGDKYKGFSQSNNIYSKTMHFEWGTANILKKELTANPALVFAVVPEYKILINAENIDQIINIKSIRNINGAQ